MLQSSGKLAKSASGISKDKISIKKIHIAQCRTKGLVNTVERQDLFLSIYHIILAELRQTESSLM